VEQKDQKIGKYEDGSAPRSGRESTVLAGLLVNFNFTSLRQGLGRLSLLPNLLDLPDLSVESSSSPFRSADARY
jgi:hypothetical protein